MNIRHMLGAAAISLSVLASGLAPALAAEGTKATVKTDAQVAAELGILQGDGSGVNTAYLAKATSRIQAAILFLRLQGLESAALSYRGNDNFADADKVADSNKAVMAYLKANPNLGWTGTGDGKFDPLANVTAQQYYKVLAEALGYKQGTDFDFDHTLDFVRTLGLSKVAGAGSLRNSDIAVATLEALRAKVKGGSKTLAASLADLHVIDAAKAAAAASQRVDLVAGEKGAYLVDGDGKTLYYFTKDTAGVSACNDKCVSNWPLFYADPLQVGPDLNPADFAAIVREDGRKQTTYKGMPLYYFANDEKPGDIRGDGVGGVWFLVKPPTVNLGTNETVGTYLTDAEGRTLYRFTKDTEGRSACYGKCEQNWPIYFTNRIQVPEGLNAGDFATITRDDGTKQTTYQGWPLYYYIEDEQPGDVKGEGVGDVWFVLREAATAGGPSGGGTGSDKPAEAKTVTVDISNFAFSPKELRIAAGTEVIFTNKDEVKHTVTAQDGSFDSGLLDEGATFTHKFDKAGTYDIFCKPHPFMKATIVVE